VSDQNGGRNDHDHDADGVLQCACRVIACPGDPIDRLYSAD
jgi:hypothetical protein